MIRVEGNYFSFISGEIKQTQKEIIVQLLGYIEETGSNRDEERGTFALDNKSIETRN